MVDSWYCLDRVVPERMSQVWKRSEARNHKRRSLNTRLSSGTSANTSCRSRNAPGRMIRSDLFWYGNNLKMKPTYREKNLLDYLFGGFRSTLKGFKGRSSGRKVQDPVLSFFQNSNRISWEISGFDINYIFCSLRFLVISHRFWLVSFYSNFPAAARVHIFVPG